MIVSQVARDPSHAEISQLICGDLWPVSNPLSCLLDNWIIGTVLTRFLKISCCDEPVVSMNKI